MVLTVSKSPSSSSAAVTGEGFDGINPQTNLYAYSYKDLWLSIALQ